MQLISVNLGRERKIQRNHKTYRSGIFKEPVEGPVQINTLGLAGDVVKDSKNHGGVDQAVYIYGVVDYVWWENELGRELPPGTFGENLTISELESTGFQAGDRLGIGEVVLEVTAPRIPCGTLAARMKDPLFARRFRLAERPGLYCRVIQPGQVRAGLAVTVQPYTRETVSILEMYRDFYEPDGSEAGLRRFLAAPIDIRSRLEKESLLSDLKKGD
jgi:MOSC domain-containing protein YiiM